MTIKVALPPNPLTQMAQLRKNLPNYAKTNQSKALLRALQRYWNLEINGYTILISGHRGAGKTTLVNMILSEARHSKDKWHEENAKRIEEAIPQLKSQELLYDREILPVYIDAPSLFEQPSSAPIRKKAQIDSADPSCKNINLADKNGNDDSPVEMFLKNLMAAFYRDLTEYVTSRAIGSDTIQDRELANHLSIDMDRAPDADLLRDYWRRFDGLRYGLFFNHGDFRPTDQPFRELSAICTAAQAYQKVIGDLEDKRSRQDMRKHHQASTPPVQPLEVHIGNDKEKKEQSASAMRLITAGLFGFLSGGSVLAVELNDVEPSFYFTIAGVTLVASVVGYGFSSMFSKTSRERQDGVQKDLSLHTDLASLSRDLPALLNRTRMAGLYPVFIIDEMDKLENVREDINNVISHIKRLLADNGVFIFLCDRNYFEYLEVSDMEGKHLPEATYFQHRLFIAYRPVEIFNHLVDVFDRYNPDLSKRNAEEYDDYEDTYHLELLAAILIIMRRGRMHQSEMNRELYKLPDERGLIDIELRFDKNNNWQELATELYIQVAILCAIEETPYIAAKMRESTLFTQQVYDAAFYPLRLRDMNQLEFCITIEALSDHFQSREELGGITEKEIADLKEAGIISDEIEQKLTECVEPEVTKNGCSDVIERVRRKTLYGSQKNSFSNIRLLERLSHNVVRNLSNPDLILKPRKGSDPLATIWLNKYCHNDDVKEKFDEGTASRLVYRLHDQFADNPLLTRIEKDSGISYKWNYWDETVSIVPPPEQAKKDVEEDVAQHTEEVDNTAHSSAKSDQHLGAVQNSGTLRRLESATRSLKSSLELCDINKSSIANIGLLGRYGYLPVNYSAKKIKDSLTLVEELMLGNLGINLTEYDLYLEDVQKPNFIDTTEISETVLSSYEELDNAIIAVEACNEVMFSQRKNLMSHFLIASVIEIFINSTELIDRTSTFWRAFEICGEVLGLSERQDLNNSDLVLDPIYKKLRSLFGLTDFFRRGVGWETRKWVISTLKQVNETRENLKQESRKETHKVDISQDMLVSWASLERTLSERSSLAYNLKTAANDLLLVGWPNVLERSRRNFDTANPHVILEMIAFAQRIGPAKFVELNRRQTTIAGWSGLLLDTWKNIRELEKSNPEYDDLKRIHFRLFEYSSSQLGVEILIALLINETNNTAKKPENSIFSPRQIDKHREGYLVIVEEGAAANIAHWQPDRNIGAIAVDREKLYEVLEMVDRVEELQGEGSLMLEGRRKLFIISGELKGKGVEACAYNVGSANRFKESDWSTFLDMFRPSIKAQELKVSEGNLSEIYHLLTIN